jgi:FtsZ-interacting cell division protein ZipA
MKKLKRILFFNTTLLFAGLLLSGCSDVKDTDTVSNTDTTDKESTVESKSSSESENSHTEESNETSSKTNKNEKSKADSVNEEDELNTESESNVSDVKESQEETNPNKNGDQVKENNSSIQSENQQIHDSATAEEKQKAVSLVKSYLRDRGQLEEDENHFVEYDGTINEYIIVRYSTLLSGHSSTNGRYAVDLTKGEVIDVTSANDFDKLFN